MLKPFIRDLHLFIIIICIVYIYIRVLVLSIIWGGVESWKDVWISGKVVAHGFLTTLLFWLDFSLL